ncbi:MAG: hypothetical protein CMF05_05995 [Hyphomonas sp.]|nr:hypothetical protein [Hyphomonas sp.]
MAPSSNLVWFRRREAFSAGLHFGQAPLVQRVIQGKDLRCGDGTQRLLQIFPRQIDTYVNVNLASLICRR